MLTTPDPSSNPASACGLTDLQPLAPPVSEGSHAEPSPPPSLPKPRSHSVSLTGHSWPLATRPSPVTRACSGRLTSALRSFLALLWAALLNLCLSLHSPLPQLPDPTSLTNDTFFPKRYPLPHNNLHTFRYLGSGPHFLAQPSVSHLPSQATSAPAIFTFSWLCLSLSLRLCPERSLLARVHLQTHSVL